MTQGRAVPPACAAGGKGAQSTEDRRHYSDTPAEGGGEGQGGDRERKGIKVRVLREVREETQGSSRPPESESETCDLRIICGICHCITSFPTHLQLPILVKCLSVKCHHSYKEHDDLFVNTVVWKEITQWILRISWIE